MSTVDIDPVVANVKAHVKEYMNQFDASHDYEHIERVLKLARTIEERECILNPSLKFRSDLITLTALTHDIGDKKYIKPGQDSQTMAYDALIEAGCATVLAKEVQLLVNHVSWSSEQADPSKVQAVLKHYPELAIIQDADRLDALGAVGVGRCFVFTASRGKSLGEAIQHFEDKLLSRGMAMKTLSGQALSSERMRRLRTFRTWWQEELAIEDSRAHSRASESSVGLGP
jgi:uncharacterized protein